MNSKTDFPCYRTGTSRLVYNIVLIVKVSKKTLVEIVKKLMVHMDKAEGTTYRDELLSKIVDICSQNNYQYITNFEWSASFTFS